ncbi:MAG: rhomboid family intramembrane serine protease [Erysipelotrichales bacterium]|nr:rhomboid family intramembrane serine protease [Erysipelotrichales bacterium]MBQ5541932.1 rhomboid family intramembrane serine protease [Erysipelotrichales bacterium]
MRKISWNSPVILWFVFICTAALGLNYLTGGKSNRLVFEVYRSSLKDPLFYVRLFGHIFGHVNFAHFANNMMYILLLGPIVEEKYGSKNLVLLMAVTAVVTGLVQVLLFPRTALLGASGIVFLLIMMSAVVGEGKDIPLTLILVVVVYFGNQIAEGLLEADKVSQLTHIIGGVIGLAGGWRLTRR